MKKIIIILLAACMGFAVKAQTISDSATLRNYINQNIIPNSTRSITASQLNAILNGILNTMNTKGGTSVPGGGGGDCDLVPTYLDTADFSTPDPGQITLQPSDLHYYGWTGYGWLCLDCDDGGGGGGGSYFAGNGLLLSSSTFRADTLILATRNWRDKLADSLAAIISGKQPQLNGTGFIKASGTTISYDNSTYLTANQTISFTPSGDISSTGGSSGTALTPVVTVSGIKGTSVPTLSTGNLRYNGSAWVFDNTTYLSSISGISAGGDLGGTYPNPTVTWSGGYTAYDARYLQTISGITAGGDLSGTYANPTVAKLNGQLPGYYLDRANHTGTQTISTIIDFPSQTGNSGKYLTTNGSALSWGVPSASLTSTYIGVGDVSNVLSGSANFTRTSDVVTTIKDNIGGTTAASGLVIKNTSLATGTGATQQQWAPSIYIAGQGWKTAGTPGSEEVGWLITSKSLSGSSAISSLDFSLVNGAGTTSKFTFTGSGNSTLSIPNITLTSLLTVPTIYGGTNASVDIAFNATSKIYGNADGGVQFSTQNNFSVSNGYKVWSRGEIMSDGGVTVPQLATPVISGITQTGTPGSTTYKYKVVAKLVNGQTTDASAEVTTTTGNATLNGTNRNQISWNIVNGAYQYLVYRTFSGGTPSTTGLITTISSTTTLSYLDAGAAGDGSTPPTINSTGNVAIGVTTSTAALNIRAAADKVGGGQIKMATGGTMPTAPEDGLIGIESSNAKIDIGSTRYIFAKTLTNTASLDFPSTNATDVADLTITVTGASSGDAVALGLPNSAVTSTATYTAWVSASNTVTIRFSPKATEDPSSGTFRISVIKY